MKKKSSSPSTPSKLPNILDYKTDSNQSGAEFMESPEGKQYREDCLAWQQEVEKRLAEGQTITTTSPTTGRKGTITIGPAFSSEDSCDFYEELLYAYLAVREAPSLKRFISTCNEWMQKLREALPSQVDIGLYEDDELIELTDAYISWMVVILMPATKLVLSSTQKWELFLFDLFKPSEEDEALREFFEIAWMLTLGPVAVEHLGERVKDLPLLGEVVQVAFGEETESADGWKAVEKSLSWLKGATLPPKRHCVTLPPRLFIPTYDPDDVFQVMLEGALQGVQVWRQKFESRSPDDPSRGRKEALGIALAGKLPAYVRTAAKRRFLDVLKYECALKRGGSQRGVSLDGELDEDTPDAEAEERAEESIFRIALEHSLEKYIDNRLGGILSPKEMQVVRLCKEGKEIPEIATVLRITEEAADKRFDRALRKIKANTQNSEIS